MFSNRFFDFLKHPCADGIHRSTKGIYRLSGVKIKHLLEILMLEVVVGTFHEPAIHRIGYAVCHRIFESYFDVEFIILLKEAVGNDVEELLFVIVPILSRQCRCNIFKLCFQHPVSGNTEGTLHRFHDIGAVFRRHLPRFQFRGRTANAGIRHIKHIAQIRFIPVHHKQSNAGRATLYISAVIFSVPVLIGLAKGRIGALSINHHLFRIGELIVAGHRSQKRSPVICVRGDFPNRFFC